MLFPVACLKFYLTFQKIESKVLYYIVKFPHGQMLRLEFFKALSQVYYCFLSTLMIYEIIYQQMQNYLQMIPLCFLQYTISPLLLSHELRFKQSKKQSFSMKNELKVSDPSKEAQEIILMRKLQALDYPPLYFNSSSVKQTFTQKHKITKFPANLSREPQSILYLRKRG